MSELTSTHFSSTAFARPESIDSCALRDAGGEPLLDGAGLGGVDRERGPGVEHDGVADLSLLTGHEPAYDVRVVLRVLATQALRRTSAGSRGRAGRARAR